jgi:lipopolysaccharide export system protein LptC
MTPLSRARYWLPLLPLLGLLGITYWLNQQVQPGSARPDAARRHDPDAIMNNFLAIKMNDQGTPHFIVSAKEMRHYPDDNSATLEVPRITMLTARRPTVHAIAKRGTVTNKSDEIFLHEDVEVLREATPDQGELTLQTEYLRIVPGKDWANTDHPVTIFDARNTVRATGMEMDNKARTIKLLSQVRSEHEPARN